MARRKKVKLENTVSASVPLSSMIDVVFLLLIYFIMTQKKVVNDVYLQTALPDPSPSQSSAQNVERSMIEVNWCDAEEVNGQIVDKVGHDNDWYWDRKIQSAKTQAEVDNYEKQKVVYYGLRIGPNYQELTRDQLVQWLKDLKATNPEAMVIIKCDMNARHKKLIDVLDICSEVQLKEVSLLHSNDTGFVPLSLKESQERYGIRPGEETAR